MTGHIDVDDNGCSLDEIGIPNLQFEIVGEESGSFIVESDEFGSLNFEAVLDEYVIRPIGVDPDIFYFSPQEFVVNTNDDNYQQDLRFCIKPFSRLVLNSKIDLDGDGCEVDERGLPYLKYSVDNGSEVLTVISDEEGNSNAFSLDEVYTITPLNIDERLYTYEPEEIIFDASTAASQDSLFFCLTRLPEVIDLGIEMTPLDDFRPGFETRYRISYTNYGTDPISGTVRFSYDFLKTVY